MSPRKQSSRQFSGRNIFRRNVETRDRFPSILIVTEGEKTEPFYFRAFDLHNARVVIENAKGTDPQTVAERAIELKTQAAKSGAAYQSVWIVFDRDSHDLLRFKRAFSLAEEHGIEIAYSNPCFEVWYLLHFNYFESALDRKACVNQLKQALGGSYQKNDAEMNLRLRGRIEGALKNAERQYANVIGDGQPDPAADCPTTTVHRLVSYLRKHER